MQQLTYYIERYTNGSITKEELQQFAALLKDPEQRKALEELMQEPWTDLENSVLDFPEARQRIEDAVLKRVAAEEANKNPVRKMPILRYWWAAASVLLLLTAGIFWWRSDKNTQTEKPATVVVNTPELQPAKTGAVLTLADGSQVSLDTFRNATVALQGGVTAKVVNGALVYSGEGNEVVYNTMSTPKGRIFRMKLPDGTEVWLNSASSVRYPTSFTGTDRKVEITGEAYFQVAKDSRKPFIVNVNKQSEIMVLGTDFNVNAYDNEEQIKTTLLEGSVKVSAASKSEILKPGEQAQVNISGNRQAIKVLQDVNTGKVTAWKNGAFDFNDATLEEVMRELERWYDIDVVYEKGIPPLIFGGKVSRDLSLQAVLRGLEASEVHFRVEGRRVVVMP